MHLINNAFSQIILSVICAKKTYISPHQANPLASFTTAFMAILVSEIGDKTFFLAMIMAIKFNKLTVFIGSVGALTIMTILSAVGGKFIFSLVPKFWTDLIVTLLFFFFGFKLIYEACTFQDPQQGENTDIREVEQQVNQMEIEFIKKSQKQIGIPVEDDLTVNTEQRQRFKMPAQQIILQAFIMTFLGQWGDRSQIAVIALAGTYDLFMVSIGALVSHILCTGAAVQLGEWISKRVSERQIRYVGGIVFVISGIVTLYMMFENQKE